MGQGFRTEGCNGGQRETGKGDRRCWFSKRNPSQAVIRVRFHAPDIRSRSSPSTALPGRVRVAATCDQPPGAAPRSSCGEPSTCHPHVIRVMGPVSGRNPPFGPAGTRLAYDGLLRAENAVDVVDLRQLEGRAAAQVLSARLLHERVAVLPCQPLGRPLKREREREGKGGGRGASGAAIKHQGKERRGQGVQVKMGSN